MSNASDCVSLDAPWPDGHYRETTHTAITTDMSREVRSAKDGEAVLTCGALGLGGPDVRGVPHGGLVIARARDRGGFRGSECIARVLLDRGRLSRLRRPARAPSRRTRGL
jgi:hypothetical protein